MKIVGFGLNHSASTLVASRDVFVRGLLVEGVYVAACSSGNSIPSLIWGSFLNPLWFACLSPLFLHMVPVFGVLGCDPCMFLGFRHLWKCSRDAPKSQQVVSEPLVLKNGVFVWKCVYWRLSTAVFIMITPVLNDEYDRGFWSTLVLILLRQCSSRGSSTAVVCMITPVAEPARPWSCPPRPCSCLCCKKFDFSPCMMHSSSLPDLWLCCGWFIGL